MAAAATAFSLVDFLKDVSGPILGFVVSGIGLSIWNTIQRRASLPAANGKKLSVSDSFPTN